MWCYSYLSFWSPVWRCWAWPLAVALSLLTSSGSNWARLRSAWLRWAPRVQFTASVPTVCVWAPGVCVEAPGVCVGTQAHGRGMGFSPDTTSHTHPQRAGRKRARKVFGSVSLYLCLAGIPSTSLSRYENELVSERKPWVDVAHGNRLRDLFNTFCFVSILCLSKDTACSTACSTVLCFWATFSFNT